MKETGTYTVVLTSTGKNFVAEGQKTASFKVVAGSATITATDQTVTYNGEAQAISGVTASKGTAVITYYATAADRTAKENGSTEAPTNAGTYYVQVTQGDNNYTSEAVNVTYTIEKAAITSVTLDKTSLSYTGKEQTVNVAEVKAGELTLQEKDYTVSGNAATEIGKHTVTVTAAVAEGNNFTGSATTEFTIGENALTAEMVQLATTEYVYDGTAKKPEVIAQGLTLGTDYTVAYTDSINAGTAKATVTGKGGYTGTVELTYTISKADFAGVTIAEIADLTYTGEALTPTLNVTLNSLAVAAEEYTAAYRRGETTVEEVKEAGTYTVILTSTGKNFVAEGQKTASFKVVAGSATITATDQTVTYNGEAQAISGVTASKGTAVITYYATAADRTAKENGSTQAPTNAGTYYVQVTQGDNNYTSEAVNVTYTIEKAAITSVTLDKTSLSYTGKEQTVNVAEVKAGNLTLAETDYTVSGNTATEIGEHTVTVTAAEGGNFKGTATAKFTINNKELTAEEVFEGNTEVQYASYFSASEDLNLGKGLAAYIVTGISGNSVTVTQLSYIPKNVPVLVERAEGVSTIEEQPTTDGNMLRYATEETTIPNSNGTAYVLYKDMYVRTTNNSVPAGKSYLLIPARTGNGARQLAIKHAGDTDGIETIEAVGTQQDIWYDLQGRRIERPTKTGLYIKNGKKTVVKNEE